MRWNPTGLSEPFTTSIPVSFGYVDPGSGVLSPQSHINRASQICFPAVLELPYSSPILTFSSPLLKNTFPLSSLQPLRVATEVKSPRTRRRLRKFPPTEHVTSGPGLSAGIGQPGEAPPLGLPALPPAVAQCLGCPGPSGWANPLRHAVESDSGEGGRKPEGAGMKGRDEQARESGL